MNFQQLIPAYENFHSQIDSVLNIRDEDGYDEALSLLEEIMDYAGDAPGDPYGDLIDMIGRAINAYELKNDNGLKEFIAESNSLPTDITLLSVLIDQNGLTYDDLPEIGKKSMVSQVMNQQRKLSRKAIEALSKRFGISPKMFFD